MYILVKKLCKTPADFGKISAGAGIWRGLEFWVGTIYPGTIYPGTIHPGTIYPGTIYPGTVYPGLHYSLNEASTQVVSANNIIIIDILLYISVPQNSHKMI